MTEELLQQANRLNHTITDLDAEITIVEEMHHSDNNLRIKCSEVGEITISDDDELKDDIIDMVLRHLNQQKEAKEDEFRML